MRIVHTADVHLRNASDERWEALGVVIEAAARLEAQVLAIGGDLFDRHVDAPSLKADLRRRFERFPGRVLIIPGNHDERGLRPGDFFGENTRVLAGRDVVADVDGVRFVGLPFEGGGIDETLRRVREAAKRRLDGAASVLLFHGELLDLSPVAGAFGEEEAREYMPVRLSDFGGLGFDYVLAGHFHRTHDVHAYDGGYFVYPGSPVSVTRRETGRRHLNLVELGKAPVPVPLDTHHFVDVDIHLSPSDETHPLTRVEENLRDLHPRASAMVTVRGFVNLDRVGMSETEFHQGLKEIRARHNVVELDKDRCLDAGTIVGSDLFRRFDAKLASSGMEDGDRAAVRELAIRAMREVIDAR